MRVAFHAINGVGLGHLVRVTALAEEVRALHPGAAVLVLTSAVDTSMLTRAGLDFVRFPPRLAEPHADPDRARRALPAPLEHAALAAALDAFRPDLVVFDTHAPAALARHAAAIGARVVLVQRELRPEALAAFFASGAAAAFDRIVVPHEPGEVDLRGAAHLPVVVTGPVVRRLDVERARAPRAARPPRVVMMAGGGGQPVEARRFLRAAADAHILARARIPALTTLLVAGPYGEVPEHLHGIAGIEVTRSCADLPARMARASLVVAQAGYNSVAEIRALEKPAILVPGHRKAEDQAARAQRLVDAGAAVTARPEARAIADRLESLLLSPPALAAMVEAHRRHPLVPQNRATAEAILRPVVAGREVRRAVLVAHEFAPRVGGMETVAQALAAGLVARGIEVRVYAAIRLRARGLGPARGHRASALRAGNRPVGRSARSRSTPSSPTRPTSSTSATRASGPGSPRSRRPPPRPSPSTRTATICSRRGCSPRAIPRRTARPRSRASAPRTRCSRCRRSRPARPRRTGCPPRGSRSSRTASTARASRRARPARPWPRGWASRRETRLCSPSRAWCSARDT